MPPKLLLILPLLAMLGAGCKKQTVAVEAPSGYGQSATGVWMKKLPDGEWKEVSAEEAGIHFPSMTITYSPNSLIQAE